ncbi:MAG TPA: thioredoxin domain-containing protein [Rhizomicrobium sp.]|jgi:protein-disulfide isomerase
MSTYWKSAFIGGLAGAVLSFALMVGAHAVGFGPEIRVSDSSMHAYLVSHPEILVEMSNRLQAQQEDSDDVQRQKAVDRLGLKAYFDPRLAFVTGPANAHTTVVEFFDYNCPYCRASIPAVKKFYATHRDARFSFIEFPIKGPKSVVAARAALAAREQPDKYLAFHFALMGEDGPVDEKMVFADAAKAGLDVTKLKSDMAASKIDLALAASHTLAEATHIDGTPAFIVNGKIREGAMDDGLFAQMTKK